MANTKRKNKSQRQKAAKTGKDRCVNIKQELANLKTKTTPRTYKNKPLTVVNKKIPLTPEEIYKANSLEILLRRAMVAVIAPSLRRFLVKKWLLSSDSNLDFQCYLFILIASCDSLFDQESAKQTIYLSKKARNSVAHGSKRNVLKSSVSYVAQWRDLVRMIKDDFADKQLEKLEVKLIELGNKWSESTLCDALRLTNKWLITLMAPPAILASRRLLSNSEEMTATKIHFSLGDVVSQIFAPAIHRYMISVGMIRKGNETYDLYGLLVALKTEFTGNSNMINNLEIAIEGRNSLEHNYLAKMLHDWCRYLFAWHAVLITTGDIAAAEAVQYNINKMIQQSGPV